MHSVEAFLAVADVTGDETWRERAGRIIKHVLGWAEATIGASPNISTPTGRSISNATARSQTTSSNRTAQPLVTASNGRG